MSDAVGVLETVTPNELEDHLSTWVVRRRDGSTAAIPSAAIASVRPAGDQPRRSAQSTIGIEELERIAAAGWQPIERRALGDWLLRAAGGFTGRANSVLPLGGPHKPLDAALDEVLAYYRDHALRAKFQVPLPLRQDLDDELAQRQWQAENPTLVMTTNVSEALKNVDQRNATHQVTFDATPSDSWLATYSYRGEPIPEIAREVMTNASHPVFAQIASDTTAQSLVAVARGAITGSWLGITAVDVLKSHRRQGLATSIVAALLEHAHECGCRYVYLQVAEENTPARAMYDRLGFTEHHRYHYRLGPTHTRPETMHA